jgi:MFS family permease
VFSLMNWAPSFFVRVHGWSLPKVGLTLGCMNIATGFVGALSGSAIAQWFWRRGRRDANLWTATLFIGFLVFPILAALHVNDATVSLGFFALTHVCMAAPTGPIIAAIPEIAPNRLRGQLTAVYYAMLGLVGMTVGPLVIGLMNDHVFAGHQNSVAKSLSLVAVTTLPIAAVCLFYASRQRAKVYDIEAPTQ